MRATVDERTNIMRNSTAKIAAQHSLLLVIDMQERLLPAMTGPGELVQRACALVQTAHQFAVPAVASEQYPKGLGPTVDVLRQRLDGRAPILAKREFSCMQDAALSAVVLERARQGRRQVVVTGVESHVCVLQTVLDLLAESLEVFVAVDAVGSRRDSDKSCAMARLREEGARVVTTEMVLFEWLRSADSPAFKDVSGRIKELS
jgi:nicotinamidase-related amidase